MKVKAKAIPLKDRGNVTDISYAYDEYGEILISAHGRGGVFAYKTETGKLQWSLKEKQPGMEKDMDAHRITTDDRGNLFVSDYANRCMQMFSVSDGRYLGCLFRDKERELGAPVEVRCCKEMSFLVVIDSNKWISKVELMYNNVG